MAWSTALHLRALVTFLAVCTIAALMAPTPANSNITLPASRCSGALAIMQGMPPDQKALLLTNGHCIGFGSYLNRFLAPGETYAGRSVSGIALVGNEKQNSGRLRYRRLLFATMTGTDLAVFELEKSYAAILREVPNVKVYTVSRSVPIAGTNTTIRSARQNMTFRCTVEAVVPVLKEGPWTWSNLVRFAAQDDCRFRPGVSGSPVLSRNGQLVALAQTFNSGGMACSINNPCEVGSDGSTIVPSQVGQSYGTPTALLYDCLEGPRFNFAKPGCVFKQ